MNITKRKYCLYIDDIIVAFPASYLKKKKKLGDQRDGSTVIRTCCSSVQISATCQEAHNCL